MEIKQPQEMFLCLVEEKRKQVAYLQEQELALVVEVFLINLQEEPHNLEQSQVFLGHHLNPSHQLVCSVRKLQQEVLSLEEHSVNQHHLLVPHLQVFLAKKKEHQPEIKNLQLGYLELTNLQVFLDPMQPNNQGRHHKHLNPMVSQEWVVNHKLHLGIKKVCLGRANPPLQVLVSLVKINLHKTLVIHRHLQWVYLEDPSLLRKRNQIHSVETNNHRLLPKPKPKHLHLHLLEEKRRNHHQVSLVDKKHLPEHLLGSPRRIYLEVKQHQVDRQHHWEEDKKVYSKLVQLLLLVEVKNIQ